MEFWQRLWRRKQPQQPEKKAHRWGIHRDKTRESASTIYYAEGKLKQFSHIRLFRITVRRRKTRSLLEPNAETRACINFILESERRELKREAAQRLFCRTPEFGIEVMALDHQGHPIDLCKVGFCLHEQYMDSPTVARKMADFVRLQLEDQGWEMSSFFGKSGNGSKLLVLGAMLAAYYHAITRWNQ